MRIDKYKENIVNEATALILQNKPCDLRAMGHVIKYLAVHAKKQKDYLQWRNFLNLLENLEKVREEDFPKLYKILWRNIPKYGEFGEV